MNKLYLIITLIAPIFGFFGTIAKWLKPQENKKPSKHEQIQRNLTVKHIHINSYGAEKSTGLDELGVKMPNIPSLKKHDRVVELKPLIDERSVFQSLDDKFPAANQQDWDQYRLRRYKKRYENHKMAIDKNGQPYRIEED